MIVFEESGMQFEFSKKDTYWVEKTTRHRKTDGVSSVECVVLHKNIVKFIEAKMSAPNKYKNGIVGTSEDFVKYINSMYDKINDSLHMLLAEYHHVKKYSAANEYDYLGENLRGALDKNPKMMFVIIVKNNEPKWNVPIQDELKQKLAKLNKIWRMNVSVINEDDAKTYGLINQHRK